MNLRKNSLTLAAAAALAAVAALGLAAPAGAATAAHRPAAAAAAAAGGTAPACVHRHVHSTIGYARLSNYCGKTMYVQVLVTNGGSSPCMALGNGKAVVWPWTSGIQSYRRTAVC
jgi:hypothetical protein